MAATAKKPRVPTADWSRHFDQMMWLSDPELVLLKGQLLLEQILYFSAAVRLRAHDDQLPKIPFGTLVDIAFIGVDPERRKRVLWYNDLRNSLAHEFNALESVAFAGIVRRFGIGWPITTPERSGLLKCLTDYTCKIAFRHSSDHHLPPISPDGVESFMNLLHDAREIDREIAEAEASLASGVVPDSYLNVRQASPDEL
jgi:hypothetical protein